MKKNSIALVITYFGTLPTYIDYFLKTCAFNKDIDFLFFGDKLSPSICESNNIKILTLSLASFNTLASTKLQMKVAITGGYKLCDFKPMYGKIYEDQLVEYDFWGFCDIDMLFGDLSKILTKSLLNNYDIISAHDQYLSGPFSLFRNIQEINLLFAKSKDIERVVSEEKVLLFDEASNVIHHLWEGKNIFDFPSEIESMTHLLENQAKCSARILLSGFITERVKESLTWQDGILRDEHNKEIFIFHYIVYKNKLSFTVPIYKQESIFYFDKHGFSLATIKSKTLERAHAFTTNLLAKIWKKVF